MGGYKALSKVQLGAESTPGTAVAADFIWRGPFAGLQDSRETVMVEEDIGVAMPSSRKFNANLFAEMSMPATPATPEQFPHILEAGVKGGVTGVEDGTGGSGYMYEYPFGISSINTVKTYTIESGDNAAAEEAEYSVVSQFVLSAVRGELVQMSAEWFGRQVSASTFTGALTPPTVSEIAAVNSELYIDDDDGAFGDTLITAGNLLEAVLTVSTGQAALFTADSGQLYFVQNYFNIEEVEATLELKFLHDTAAIAERAKWRANENRVVRLNFIGDALGTAGSGPTLGSGNKGIQVDFPGSYESFSAVEHEDGLSIVTATLTGGYIAELGEALTIRVVNELASLP